MTPSDRYVWHCPACGRNVPQRVDACRCGFSRPDDTGQVEAPARRRSALPLLIGLMLGLGLPAMSFWSPWTETARLAPGAMPASPASSEPDLTLADAGRDGTPGQSGREGVPVSFGDAPPGSAAPASAARDPQADPTLAGVTPGVTKPVAAVSPVPGALEDVIAQVLPAVVSIQAGQGRGTGFFVRPDVVLTNAHVVGEESSVRLTAGEHTYTARVSTDSASSDLAVLQVYNAAPQQPTLRLGTAMGLRAGQEVIAIGSALGVLSNR